MPLLADARHALRLLGRSPLFAATAVVSLSLGVAASSTVFSVADALVGPAAGRTRPVASRRCRPGQPGPGVRQHVAPRLRLPAPARHDLRGPGRRGARRPADEPDRGRIERAGLRHAGLGQLLRGPGHPGASDASSGPTRMRAGRAAGRGAHPPLLDPSPRRRSHRARPAAASQQPRVRRWSGSPSPASRA